MLTRAMLARAGSFLIRLAGGDARFGSDLCRYGLVSAAALALDWGLLLFLSHCGMDDLIAASLSFLAGMLLAYWGSIAFVYRGRRTYPVFAEAIGFAVIGVMGLGVNAGLLFVCVKLTGLGVGLAKAPTAIGVFIFNFLARRTLLFAGGADHGLWAVPSRPAAPLPVDLAGSGP